MSRSSRVLHWLASAAAVAWVLSAQAADLQAYTEEWPPYNFVDKGVVRGISTDVLRTACSQAKLECSIELVPWARAYKTAQTLAGTLAYTTARKASRENEFAWVGPILPRTTWIYVRTNLSKSELAATDLTRWRFGVVRGEAAAQDLLARGVPPSNLSEQSTNADVIRMLQLGQLDAMVDTEVGALWSLRKQGLPAGFLRKTVKLTDEGGYYFAVHRGTDPHLVNRLQAAMDSLQASGQIQRIVRTYTEGP